MTFGSTNSTEAGEPHPAARLRSFRLWSNPAGAVAFILAVELVTLACCLLALRNFDLNSDHLVRLGLLLGLAVLYSESTTRIERVRRYLASAVHVNVTTVWAVTGILALPAGYVVILLVLLLGYDGLRGKRSKQRRPHRMIFTAATVLVASVAATSAYQAIAAPTTTTDYGLMRAVGVLTALIVFFIVNWILVVTVMYLAMPSVSISDLLPGRDEQGLELATLVLGTLSAQLIVGVPLLAPLILVLMVLVQRSAMVSQLEVAATTDPKTGLLNAVAWQDLAQRELLRAQREHAPGAVMLLDLDHFKRLNDTLGHLRGDSALKAVADSLRRELRGYDAVARFGGEEFVVFLNGLPLPDATLVAERILTRIRNLVIAGPHPDAEPYQLTASIGLASYPEQGQELIELLEAADLALYSAKNSGRDRVGQLWVGGGADRDKFLRSDAISSREPEQTAREAS